MFTDVEFNKMACLATAYVNLSTFDVLYSDILKNAIGDGLDIQFLL